MHMWKREYKYLYTIKNMYNGNILYPVGSSCITKFDRKDFRDPKIWEDNGTYYMLVGCRSEEIPGQVVLFSGKDLKEWKFETILAENKTGEIGVMWECPDFFSLGEACADLFTAAYAGPGL